MYTQQCILVCVPTLSFLQTCVFDQTALFQLDKAMCQDCTDTYISNMEDGDYILHDNFPCDDYIQYGIESDFTLCLGDTFSELDVSEKILSDTVRKTDSAGDKACDKLSAEECAYMKQVIDPLNFAADLGLSEEEVTDMMNIFNRTFKVRETLDGTAQRQSTPYNVATRTRSKLMESAHITCNHIKTRSNNTINADVIYSLVQDEFSKMILEDERDLCIAINTALKTNLKYISSYDNARELKIDFYTISCITCYEYAMSTYLMC